MICLWESRPLFIPLLINQWNGLILIFGALRQGSQMIYLFLGQNVHENCQIGDKDEPLPIYWLSIRRLETLKEEIRKSEVLACGHMMHAPKAQKGRKECSPAQSSRPSDHQTYELKTISFHCFFSRSLKFSHTLIRMETLRNCELSKSQWKDEGHVFAVFHRW